MIAVYAEAEFARESSCFSLSYTFSKEPRKGVRAFSDVVVNLYARKEFLHLFCCRPFYRKNGSIFVRFHDDCDGVFPLEGRHENLVIVFDDKYGFLCCRADGRNLVKLSCRNGSQGHGCVAMTLYEPAAKPSIFHNDIIIVWPKEEFIRIPPLVIIPVIQVSSKKHNAFC